MAGKARSRARGRRRRRAPIRDWASGLPRDVLSLIFRRLGAVEVLHPVQAVCRSWRRLAAEPELWRCIDMRNHADLFNWVDMAALARNAVDRSGGHVEEFYAEYFGSDELLDYIAERTTGLKCLVLISAYDVSEEGLAKFVGQCPLLEELQIINCSFSEEACGAIGRARPELKRFSLNARYHITHLDPETNSYYDTEALEIANNMPQLLELQLIGNMITNEGLGFILDKCPLLETLDIRACFNIKVDASMKARLARVRNVRLPNDSTMDYGFQTVVSDWLGDEDDYISGMTDIDLDYDDMFGADYDFDYDDFSVPTNFFDDDDGFPFFSMFGDDSDFD